MAMKLVSMKLSKAEAKADLMLPTKPDDGPRYPYGLELRFERDQLDKLKFDPDVGCEVVIEARGVVTGYREAQRQGREPDCFAEVQITDLAISDAPESRREKRDAKRLNALTGTAES